MTGLHLAAYFGIKAVVRLLLENNSDVDAKDEWGGTPLSWAAEKGHEAVVKLLLDKGVELETKATRSGRRPLSWAETKATRFGRMPLSWAADNGHEAVVKLLLNKGAEVGIENKGGWTALQLAAINRHEGVEQLLVVHGSSEPEDFYGLQQLFLVE
jgi:ankyrin repeat protein